MAFAVLIAGITTISSGPTSCHGEQPAIAVVDPGGAGPAIKDDAKAEATEPGPKVPGLELSPGDTTVDRNRRFMIVEAKTKGTEIRWLVLGTGKVEYATMGNMAIIGVPDADNSIHVYAVTAVDGKVTQFARSIITVGKGPPGPGPTPPNPPNPPGPPNPPKPVVTAGPLFVVVVDDGNARSSYPYMARIVNSNALRASVTKAGHKFVVLDVTDETIKSRNLAKYLPGGKAPALIIMDQKGVVLVNVPCPQDPNDVVAYVNKTVSGAKR